jgi:recombination protein RecT
VKVVSECWKDYITKKVKIGDSYKNLVSISSADSIRNSFAKMVNLGLSTMKRQGYFLQDGNQQATTFSVSYLGHISIVKRDLSVVRVVANAVYESDELEYEIDVETGYKKIILHKQSIGNINNAKILGAYAIVSYSDGTKKADVMSFQQIQNSWNMGGSGGKSKAHLNFPEEMAKKTVINRILKEDLSTNGIIVEDEIAGEAEEKESQSNSTQVSSKIQELKSIRAEQRSEPTSNIPTVSVQSVLHPADNIEPKQVETLSIEEDDPF